MVDLRIKRGNRASLAANDNAGVLSATTDTRELWFGLGGGSPQICVSRPKPRIITGTFGPLMNIDGTGLDIIRITVTANCVINMTGGEDGSRLILELTQGGAGNYTVTLGSGFNWGSDMTSYSSPTMAVGKMDRIGLIYRSTMSAYDVVAIARGF